MAGPKRIALITNGYPDPDAPEHVFIAPEVEALTQAGHQITLFPLKSPLHIDPNLPEGVRQDLSLARQFRVFRLLRHGLFAVLRPAFWREFLACRKAQRPLDGFRRFLKESLRAEASASLAPVWRNHDLVYTYWCMGETFGLTRCPGTPVISRAHGNDLYLESSKNGGYLPYQSVAHRAVHHLLLLSSQAQCYATDRHQVEPGRIRLSPLGVANQGHPGPAPDPKGPVHLLSVALPWPVKRLPLIGTFAAALKKALPMDREVHWVHFGAPREALGPDLRKGVRVEAFGPVPHSTVLNYLAQQPIHIFVNLSSSEGTPVTLMEAMSFGVPVIAPAIGGIPELLSEGGGILVPVEPNVDSLAVEVVDILQDPAAMNLLRAQAIATQRARFDVEANHRGLAQWLWDLELPTQPGPAFKVHS